MRLASGVSDWRMKIYPDHEPGLKCVSWFHTGVKRTATHRNRDRVVVVLSQSETPTRSKSNPRARNLCRGVLKVAYHPVHPLNETILVATMHDQDTVSFSYNPLALPPRDILEYRGIFDLVVTVGLDLCGDSVQGFF